MNGARGQVVGAVVGSQGEERLRVAFGEPLGTQDVQAANLRWLGEGLRGGGEVEAGAGGRGAVTGAGCGKEGGGLAGQASDVAVEVGAERAERQGGGQEESSVTGADKGKKKKKKKKKK